MCPSETTIKADPHATQVVAGRPRPSQAVKECESHSLGHLCDVEAAAAATVTTTASNPPDDAAQHLQAGCHCDTAQQVNVNHM